MRARRRFPGLTGPPPFPPFRFLAAWILAAAIAVSPARVARSQSPAIAASSPISRLSESFFERIGVGFGFHLNGPHGGVFFRQGGVNSASPPLGGHAATADARMGFGVGGSNGGFSASLAAGQGSDRSFVSQSPTVTVAPGAVGGLYQGVLRPFVTGIAPIVGGWRTSPLIERLQRLEAQSRSSLQAGAAASRPGAAPPPVPEAPPGPADRPGKTSTAQRGDLSVAEIRASQAVLDAAREQEVQALLQRAEQAEQAGKAGVARIYYQQAARRATGALKQRIERKIQASRESAKD